MWVINDGVFGKVSKSPWNLLHFIKNHKCWYLPNKEQLYIDVDYSEQLYMYTDNFAVAFRAKFVFCFFFFKILKIMKNRLTPLTINGKFQMIYVFFLNAWYRKKLEHFMYKLSYNYVHLIFQILIGKVQKQHFPNLRRGLMGPILWGVYVSGGGHARIFNTDFYKFLSKHFISPNILEIGRPPSSNISQYHVILSDKLS